MKKKYLDPINRTPEIKSAINSAYNKISHYVFSCWKVCNGADNYKIFEASENYTLQYLINKYSAQKEFYVLDVGAGDFQFAENKAKFINNKIARKILPNDILVNFISIRGESNKEKEFSKIGNCNLYNLGSFKVENLAEEPRSNNILIANKLGDLAEKFDFIVSYNCLRHLVDPLGTFIQMHDALKDSGLMLTDTFKFKLENNIKFKIDTYIEDRTKFKVDDYGYNELYNI